jgi:dipeptidyl aminopeptidase/acylaminoacyl peptidase
VAGLSDLPRFLSWGKARSGAPNALGRFWNLFMGPDDVLPRISPALQAKSISIPILLIHGKDDTVVPFEQSQIMADALKWAHKPFEFVVLKSEDHWLSRGETRLQMLQATVDFLEKNNPPG